jgi:ABC-type multidrug transport system fused ATPase/permease subunit
MFQSTYNHAGTPFLEFGIDSGIKLANMVQNFGLSSKFGLQFGL